MKPFRITPSVPGELGGRALLAMSVENRDGLLLRFDNVPPQLRVLRRRIRGAVDTDEAPLK